MRVSAQGYKRRITDVLSNTVNAWFDLSTLVDLLAIANYSERSTSLVHWALDLSLSIPLWYRNWQRSIYDAKVLPG